MTNLIKEFIYSLSPYYHINDSLSSNASENQDNSSSIEEEVIPLLPGLNLAQSVIKNLTKSAIQNQIHKTLEAPSPGVEEALNDLNALIQTIKQNEQVADETYPHLLKFLGECSLNTSLVYPFLKFLSPKQKEDLSSLKQKIQSNALCYDDLKTLEEAKAIVLTLRGRQEGVVQTVTRELKDKVSLQFKALLGISPEDFDKNLELKQQAKQSNLYLHQLRKRTLQQQQIESKPVPVDLLSAIENQLFNLSNLTAQVLLIKFLFPGDTASTLFPEIYQTAQEMQSRHANMTEEMAFKEILTSTYHTKNLDDQKYPTLFYRIYLQIHLHITLPILRFYINHVFQQLNKDLSTLLKTSPDQKFEYLDACVLSPLKNHFSTVQNFLDKKICQSQEIFLETTRDSVQNFLSEIAINGKSPQKLLSELSEYLSSRYIPHLPWTKKVKEATYCPIDPVQNIVINIFLSCLNLISTSLIYTVIRPVELIMDILCKKLIEQIVKNHVLPSMLPHPATSSQNPSHSPFRHQINLILWQNFASLNNRDKSNLDEEFAPSQPILSSLRYNQIKEVIDHILKAIALEHSMNDPQKIDQTLHHKISLTSLPANLHQTLMEYISPAASVEVIKILENIIQQDFLSKLLWSALENGLTILKRPPVTISKEEMEFAEMARVDELRVTVEKAVEEAIQMALNPAEKINREIRREIQILYHEISSFTMLATHCTIEKSQELVKKWTKISHHVAHMKFCEKELLQIIIFEKELREQFLDQTNELNKAIQNIQSLYNQSDSYTKIAHFLEDQYRVLKETPDIKANQILASLNFLEVRLSSHLYSDNLGIRSFLKELKIFIRNTKNYQLLTAPDMHSEEAFQTIFTQFKEQLQLIKSTLHEQADHYLENTEISLQTVVNAATPLEVWAQSITPPRLKPQDMGSLSQKVSETLGPQFKTILTHFLMNDINTLINMLDAKAKPNHWNALLWRGVGSYLASPLQKV
ncbi:hypothetical protein [Rhabdochlamydiaceae symbiont of Dictyostelium giganteum]|uniref:hypothetical protein n=1 Tax=Rhabdochlamydiaceae symbiont of Dictyostelium giganteum TaxID=3342349 RepID=UPI00384F6CCA